MVNIYSVHNSVLTNSLEAAKLPRSCKIASAALKEADILY